MFKKLFKLSLLSLVFLPIIGFSATHHHHHKNHQYIIFINNYPNKLYFQIEQNPTVLPKRYQRRFIERPQQRRKAKIMVKNVVAYIHADNGQPQSTFAYFGVILTNGNVIVHGYLSQGIAYSMQDGEVGKVIFCSQKAYRMNHYSCPENR